MDLVIGDYIEFEDGAITRQAEIVGYVSDGYRAATFRESFIVPETVARPLWTRWDQQDQQDEIDREWAETDEEIDAILARMGQK